MKDRGSRRANTATYKAKQERLYKAYYPNGDNPDSNEFLSHDQRGRWKYHSWKNTGGCECCKNPRRAGYSEGMDKLTIQERRAVDEYNDSFVD